MNPEYVESRVEEETEELDGEELKHEVEAVLENEEYLKKHGLLENARKIGFRPEKDSSLVSGLFGRFF